MYSQFSVISLFEMCVDTCRLYILKRPCTYSLQYLSCAINYWLIVGCSGNKLVYNYRFIVTSIMMLASISSNIVHTSLMRNFWWKTVKDGVCFFTDKKLNVTKGKGEREIAPKLIHEDQ